MTPEDDDLTIVEAAQRIIARHNDDPGAPGGYVAYDPFMATGAAAQVAASRTFVTQPRRWLSALACSRPAT